MKFREVSETKQQMWNYIRYFNNVKEAFDQFIINFNSYLSSQNDFSVKSSDNLKDGVRIEVFLDTVDICMDFVERNMDIWGKLVVSVYIAPEKNEELFILYFDDDGKIYDSLEDVRPQSSFGNRYFSEVLLLMIYNSVLSRHSYVKGLKCEDGQDA